MRIGVPESASHKINISIKQIILTHVFMLYTVHAAYIVVLWIRILRTKLKWERWNLTD